MKEVDKQASPVVCMIGDSGDHLTCELQPLSLDQMETLLSHYKAHQWQLAYMAVDGMDELPQARMLDHAERRIGRIFVSDGGFVSWCLTNNKAKTTAIQMAATPRSTQASEVSVELIRKWFAISDTSLLGKKRDKELLEFYARSGFDFIRDMQKAEADKAAKDKTEREGDTKNEVTPEPAEATADLSGSASTSMSSPSPPTDSAAADTDGEETTSEN